MKYLTIGLSILAGILCAGLLFSLLAAGYVQAAEAPIREAQAVLQDERAAAACFFSSQEVWRRRRAFFACFLSHAELEEIDLCYVSLAASSGEEAELRRACAELLCRLDRLRRADSLRFDNLLAGLLPPR